MPAIPAEAGPGLPELAALPWRRRVDERALRRLGRLWTTSALCHVLPLLAAAVALGLLSPILIPISVILLAHAWAIPELYANRGAKVLRCAEDTGTPAAAVALGLLGDLVGHEARDVLRATGLVVERGRFGAWILGATGALLVRPGGRRVDCLCVRVPDPDLPGGDRIAHLLLALREDETGLLTVANLAFSGARWRVHRRLAPRARVALAHATRLAQASRSAEASG